MESLRILVSSFWSKSILSSFSSGQVLLTRGQKILKISFLIHFSDFSSSGTALQIMFKMSPAVQKTCESFVVVRICLTILNHLS